MAKAREQKPTHPAIERVRKLATLMDSALTIPVIRKKIGLDPVLSALPGAGDVVSALIALYPLYVAYELGLSRQVMTRMGVNVALDVLIGLVPVAGDIADVFWKSNLRNLEILEAEYEKHRQAALFGMEEAAAEVVDVTADPVR